jgi:hypothetical protein
MRLPAAALLFLAACGGREPSKIVVQSDTLIINGPLAVQIPVRAFNRDGRVIAHPRLAYSGGSNAVRVSNDGRVTCAADADAPVTITRKTLTKQILVRCRRIRNFAPIFTASTLIAGDPPSPPVVRAFDFDGKPVTLLHATAEVLDTSVARIRDDGRIFPLARGKTTMIIDFGGVSQRLNVEVDERVIQTPLRLVSGEVRSWRLPPGYYEIRLESPAGKQSKRSLALFMYRANCSHSSSGGQHYYCITKDNSSVIVQNPVPAGDGIELAGTLQVLRKP